MIIRINAIKWCIVAVGAAILGKSSYAGTGKPVVGEPMPEFRLNNVLFYHTKSVTNADFLGKWLILDFWSTACTSCFKSFPELDSIQRAFPDNVQVMPVAIEPRGGGKECGTVFARIRESRHLGLPCALDSVLIRKWNFHAVPRLYIVDPSGIVRYIAIGLDLTVARFEKIMSGEQVILYPAERPEPPEFSIVEVCSTGKLIYGSVLARSEGSRIQGTIPIDLLDKPGTHNRISTLSVGSLSLADIYNCAYFGIDNWGPWDKDRYGIVCGLPVLEVSDSSFFANDYSVYPARNVYGYSISSPKPLTSNEVMEDMKRLLEQEFHYLCTVEERDRPVFQVIRLPGPTTLTPTRGGTRAFSQDGTVAGFSVTNLPMEEFITTLSVTWPNELRLPVINNSGISGNIDARIEGDLTTFEGTRSALREIGFDLVPGTKQMKTLVIRDSSK